uniref:Uncharacterized protein n=1 Tax=Cucumis sativus TaxID=3659 RepID=A0A0A0KIC9_CUCSA
MRKTKRKKKSLSILRNFNIPISNFLLQILRVLTIDRTPNRNASTENLLNGSTEILSHRPGAHNPSNLNNIVKRDITIVLDVLGLLAVAFGLFEGLDDQSSSRGNHRDLGLTVLDSKLDGNSETLPFLGSLLGNVFSDLLWGET